MTTSANTSPAASMPGMPATEPAWLDQIQASAFLRTLGVVLAPKSLQKRRVIGSSPPFRKVLSRVVYERESLRTWAEAQRSPLFTSTLEAASRSS